MRAEDLMSSPVISVHPDTPVKEAAALLSEHGFTAAPVVDDDGALIGVVTEADLIRERIVRDPRGHIWPDPRTAQPPRAASSVGEVMTTPAVGMTRGADAADLATAMQADQVRSILIVDGSTVIGIVTRRDLLRALARDDQTIAADVRDRLATYGGQHRWSVSVNEGAVAILDDFDNETDRHIALVLAKTVPGVQTVRLTSSRVAQPG